MPNSETAMILSKIDGLKNEFIERNNTQNEIMKSIHEQTKKTNGRVNKLEISDNKQWTLLNKNEGAFATWKWIVGFLGTGGIVAIIYEISKIYM